MKRIVLAALLVLGAAGPARTGVSVVGGLTHEITLRPGAAYSGVIRVRNDGDGEQRVRVFQTDYRFNSEGNSDYGEAGASPRSSARWIMIDPQRLTLLPGQEASLYYEVAVPAQQDLEGTYWSVIMVEPVEPVQEHRPNAERDKIVLGVRAIVRYAVQIIVNIGDRGSSSVRVTKNQVVREGGQTILQTDIENDGDRWLCPSLRIDVYDRNGDWVGRRESGRQRIMPGCSVRHRLDLSGLPAGAYSILMIVDNGDERVFGASYEVRL